MEKFAIWNTSEMHIRLLQLAEQLQYIGAILPIWLFRH